MRRASYRFGVEWIAMNDDAAETDPEMIRDSLSVALLADLFGVDTVRVADDVIRVRQKEARMRSIGSREPVR